MKIGCGTVVFREYPLDRALAAIREAGFEYLETQAIAPWCPHVDIRRDDPVQFAEKVKAAGFKGVTALWMPDGTLVSSEKSVESGIIAVEWAGAAGIGVVNTGDGFKPQGMSDSVALGIIRRRMEAILEKAARWGVYLAIEPHGSYSLTAAGLKKLLSLVDSPWLGVNYDAANVRRAGYVESKGGSFEWKGSDEAGDEVSVLEAIAERVVHFHAKDMDDDRSCVALGEGEVKLRECIQLLRRYDYNGAVSLETEGGMTFEEDCELAKKSFEYLNKIINGDKDE